MRPAENIKRWIKNASINTSPEVNQAVLADLLNELDKSKIAGSPGTKSNICSTLARSRIAQLAAAAVIIIATCLFFMQQEQTGEIKKQEITQTPKSPAELNTFASLSFAYRKGGIPELERQCDKTLDVLGPFDNGRIRIKHTLAQFEENHLERTYYEN